MFYKKGVLGKFEHLKTPFLQNTWVTASVNSCIKPSTNVKLSTARSSRPEVFCKKGVLRNFTQACNFIKKQALTQVFSCEFCDISKNTFFSQNASGGCFCTALLIYPA